MGKKIADPQKIKDVAEFAMANGDRKACKIFNMKIESVLRYKREYNKLFGKNTSAATGACLNKIAKMYSKKELEAIAKGGRILPGQGKVPVFSFSGKKIKFGFFTDSHMGCVYYTPEWLDAAVKEFKREKVDFVAISGDVSEGMSGRPGHIYELTHLGFDAQRDYCIEQLRKIPVEMYLIDGNHDRWFIKSSGAKIVKDVCAALGTRAHYLGHDEGDISLDGRATCKLWHGEDAGSYATSYRLQKLVETFTGGEKPAVLLAGHTHKQGYFFDRHIHVFSGGTMSKQSRWMRGKRLAAHTGFWIIELTINDHGVGKCQSTWYPFYA